MRRETLPPLREDYFELGRHSHFVDVTEPEVRRVVVELLEAYGFEAEPPIPREDILRTFLPLTVNTEKKVGRNDPCPCGSGLKFKNCHGKGLV